MDRYFQRIALSLLLSLITLSEGKINATTPEPKNLSTTTSAPPPSPSSTTSTSTLAPPPPRPTSPIPLSLPVPSLDLAPPQINAYIIGKFTDFASFAPAPVEPLPAKIFEDEIKEPNLFLALPPKFNDAKSYATIFRSVPTPPEKINPAPAPSLLKPAPVPEAVSISSPPLEVPEKPTLNETDSYYRAYEITQAEHPKVATSTTSTITTTAAPSSTTSTTNNSTTKP